MADQQTGEQPPEEYTQLSQVRVPLSHAVDAFNTPDANGRLPIVVLSERGGRITSSYLMIAAGLLGVGLLLALLRDNWIIFLVAALVALALAGFSVYRGLNVTVHEGVNALVLARGKYVRTLEPGFYTLSPTVRISHLVTRREIPFDVPVRDALSADNVRANLEALVTFSINEPFKFVYNVSASDFDRVFQAACQNTFRTMIRRVESSGLSDLLSRDTADLKAALGEAVAQYGVTIQKVSITAAQLPADFLASLEARKLAALQRDEQGDRQALAQQLQADQEELARQAVVAQVARKREELQQQIQVAESRKQLVELHAEASRLRLERLQERLRDYPIAARWEVESAQLRIAYGLAHNTRAVVQLGSAREIMSSFIIGEDTDGTGLAVPNGADKSAMSITDAPPKARQ